MEAPNHLRKWLETEPGESQHYTCIKSHSWADRAVKYSCNVGGWKLFTSSELECHQTIVEVRTELHLGRSEIWESFVQNDNLWDSQGCLSWRQCESSGIGLNDWRRSLIITTNYRISWPDNSEELSTGHCKTLCCFSLPKLTSSLDEDVERYQLDRELAVKMTSSGEHLTFYC